MNIRWTIFQIGKFRRLSPDYFQTIFRLVPDYLQNNDYQNSNIKKVGGMILKQICKINILAHDTGAENPNGVRKIAKFVFSGLAILANLRMPQNMNFAILCTPLEFLNTVMPWKVRAHNSGTYFFFEFSKNLANSWKKTKMIRISLKF